ncbi:MAG: DUF362 domain-containing protein [Thermodesulfobacteriota bacterium]|nr:DUF362 domain-containing protein [Thermodesulfobacteriota bacterium]
MAKPIVSIVRYEEPETSARRVVDLAGGLEHLPSNPKVFIKPNIVFWTKAVAFPKWGVITTSRVIEDIVILLKENGVTDITIGEGVVVSKPNDRETPAHAFKTLGYEAMGKKYGVKTVNVFDRPFESVDLGGGVELNFNADILNSDFVVDIPVLKTHNQTVVSLGIKNLKGTIDIKSRKKCHSVEPGKDLNYMVARLADRMPPMLTILDGIYTLERGPAFDGKVHRSNILAASRDVLSADLVGSRILGVDPADVPHLCHAADNHNRPLDLSDVEVVGEAIEAVSFAHGYKFDYHDEEDGNMPVPLARDGIKGLFYRKYDLSMCTYCSGLNGLLLTAIRYAWKGEPWDNIEVLTGKAMQPTPGMKKTILVGKCMYQAHKDNSDIQEMIPIKGCPPEPQKALEALQKAGIDASPDLFAQVDKLPGFFMNKYAGKPEYDEAFFSVK